MIRIAFPILTTFIALLLFRRRPATYVAFTMWIWFLTPLIRRLVDYELGWTEPNLLLLAPFFVAGVSGLVLVLPARKGVPIDVPPPFVLCGLAVIYGFLIGMFLKPSAEGVYALLNWASPLLFGLYLFMHWRDYEDMRRAVQLTVAAGVTVMGTYGIYQFFVSPKWDVFWLENIQINAIDPSFGTSAPMGIRVWSTMNAPGPFAQVLMGCLLILLITPTKLKVPAAITGYSALLLSSVRTAWLSWVVGLVMMLRGLRPSTIAKILGGMLVLGACLVPIIQNPDIAPVLTARFNTFSNLKGDESLNERRDMYRIVGGVIANDPWGHGLINQEIDKNLVVDSGVLILFLQLGWLGTLMFSVGMVLFFFQKNPPPEDRFPGAARAICIAYLSQLIGGNVFVGATGAMFWICLGMAGAATRWHAEQPSQPQAVEMVPIGGTERYALRA